MGSGFSAPDKRKECVDGGRVNLRYGACSMQGWRFTMEDAHACLPHLDHTHAPDPETHPVRQKERKDANKRYLPKPGPPSKRADELSDTAFFGVFDGHGGAEVAHFVARNLPVRFTSHPDFHNGNFHIAIFKAFLLTDYDLNYPTGAAELREIRQNLLTQHQRRERRSSSDKDTDEAARDGGDSRQGSSHSPSSLSSGWHWWPFGSSSSRSASAGPRGGGAHSGGTPSCKVMGCTATCCFLKGRELLVANCGDSRIVLCKSDGTPRALTVDHKANLPSELQRIHKAGGFVTHPGGRVNGNLNLTRAFGDWNYKANSSKGLEQQIITSAPDIVRIRLADDDEFIVLACDGVWEVKSNEFICDFIRRRIDTAPSYSSILDELFELTISRDPVASLGAGCDNMTAVIVDLKPERRSVPKRVDPPPISSSAPPELMEREGGSGAAVLPPNLAVGGETRKGSGGKDSSEESLGLGLSGSTDTSSSSTAVPSLPPSRPRKGVGRGLGSSGESSVNPSGYFGSALTGDSLTASTADFTPSASASAPTPFAEAGAESSGALGMVRGTGGKLGGEREGERGEGRCAVRDRGGSVSSSSSSVVVEGDEGDLPANGGPVAIRNSQQKEGKRERERGGGDSSEAPSGSHVEGPSPPMMTGWQREEPPRPCRRGSAGCVGEGAAGVGVGQCIQGGKGKAVLEEVGGPEGNQGDGEARGQPYSQHSSLDSSLPPRTPVSRRLRETEKEKERENGREAKTPSASFIDRTLREGGREEREREGRLLQSPCLPFTLDDSARSSSALFDVGGEKERGANLPAENEEKEKGQHDFALSKERQEEEWRPASIPADPTETFREGDLRDRGEGRGRSKEKDKEVPSRTSRPSETREGGVEGAEKEKGQAGTMTQQPKDPNHGLPCAPPLIRVDTPVENDSTPNSRQVDSNSNSSNRAPSGDTDDGQRVIPPSSCSADCGAGRNQLSSSSVAAAAAANVGNTDGGDGDETEETAAEETAGRGRTKVEAALKSKDTSITL
uniref:protein-serine/threonine phosphatase n=1 Tax=Chromera velia CCMP2878 TaxID=1169474 RepID=A0A0G4HYW8_9ALVE|eukprot:Cvel_9587.t1-p1 / transcript=Cvel_9587.t1 / gene=Cvel_9587 / organism=Chromera_velia_CCMP2878 / gene_product=Probable protein phosphatase 2C 70, putative / transcript_product=Probable protein phosphatase 2C 70, putative / location=Cvel_scaffold556:37770-44342(-) / protein_length=1015 / sequence_SO=supercontig / SO=protein_coding / is_pseudo=false